jgi:hypothetical protein
MFGAVTLNNRAKYSRDHHASHKASLIPLTATHSEIQSTLVLNGTMESPVKGKKDSC